MKIITELIILCLLLTGCVEKIDQKLIGTWKSNREKSVAECFRVVPSRHKLSPQKKEKFAEIFGNITHTYSSNKVTIKNNNEISTANYKIIKRTKNQILIEYEYVEPPTETITYDLRFEDNFESFWVNKGTDFPENYTKSK